MTNTHHSCISSKIFLKKVIWILPNKTNLISWSNDEHYGYFEQPAQWTYLMMDNMMGYYEQLTLILFLGKNTQLGGGQIVSVQISQPCQMRLLHFTFVDLFFPVLRTAKITIKNTLNKREQTDVTDKHIKRYRIGWDQILRQEHASRYDKNIQ